ncbi:unnamed protein product (macronuclear) [Paramecium tetraurelia]|uniref:Uncharacterized protein n=1 Tax=Paramecium tetraurelia TaxID=5888 RepID=A0DBM7_PARTE|nr:uncharacterized protein GSPATT00015340001 [Paramecium tetraurelia]CAK80444.1 unnamed protein product [Paramecium tetraurelia]|eukprot:XP_001447841.1 hypothetical protein (macronuclear) [Paramecium tetraurelia strain d4-2]
MNLILTLTLLCLIQAQQISHGMHYLSEKFYGKLDTNVFYYYLVQNENPNYCVSNHYQCVFLNHLYLNNYIDHTLDSLKPKFMKKVFEFVEFLDTHKKAYFRDSSRRELEKSFEKHYQI